MILPGFLSVFILCTRGGNPSSVSSFLRFPFEVPQLKHLVPCKFGPKLLTPPFQSFYSVEVVYGTGQLKVEIYKQYNQGMRVQGVL